MKPLEPAIALSIFGVSIRKTWVALAASAFLVSVPVFFQAPLVRVFPWLSLALTVLWLGLSRWLQNRYTTQFWGDLLSGFTWTWLAGSVYWGWLRWEPFLHLPIEAIGLPFAVIGLWKGREKVGNLFYLGSLLGTAITDLYFYLVDLIPYWRQLMQVDLSVVRPILQAALSQMQTLWGLSWAVVLVCVLLMLSYFPLRSHQIHWWVFGGAVLNTLLVDGLFWLAATVA